MSIDALSIVRKGLQEYADRGVFRGFGEVKGARGKAGFNFVWLGNRLLNVTLDEKKGVLRFNNLLPNISSDSILYEDLKRFLKSRSDRKTPRHRRVEAHRAELSWINRGGNISIALTIKNNQYAYGLNRLVNLVHEIFVHLSDSYSDYLCENFDAPQE